MGLGLGLGSGLGFRQAHHLLAPERGLGGEGVAGALALREHGGVAVPEDRALQIGGPPREQARAVRARRRSCPKWFMGASREDKPVGQAGTLAGDVPDISFSGCRSVAGCMEMLS